MNETVKLYYDEQRACFSLMQNGGTIEVFHSHQRIGWKNGKDEFVQGPFRVVIETNFYPEAPEREYIHVDIYVNDVLLLPLSLACRKADTLYHFSEHEIAFVQWGAGQNLGKSAHTIMQTKGNICWKDAMVQICKICNEYEHWICNETKQLTETLEMHAKTSFGNISTFIELARRYEVIAPEVIPIIREFVDKYYVVAMVSLIEYIEQNQSMDDLNKRCKREYVDTIGSYIKDYHLN